MKRMAIILSAVVLAGVPASVALRGADPTSAPSTQPAPKELSDNVKSGLKWLVAQQHDDGSWSQGAESREMGNSMDALRDKGNVADTAMAALALRCAGSTPSTGPYKAQINKALDFVCKEVEAADKDSLAVTSIKGTRVQMKLGGMVDTFLASLLLGEVRKEMPDEASRKRVIAALDKVLNKIEKNQQADGSFANAGWAPVLAQGIAAKGVNVARQNGATVNDEVLGRLENNARSGVNKSTGRVAASGGSAGVELYAQSSSLSALQETSNTYDSKMAEVQGQLATAASPTTQAALHEQLDQLAKGKNENDKDLNLARQAAVERAGDSRFMAGFGSNGGEEFLSYLNIGETLFTKGGEDWTKWDKSMTENLNHIQNPDGSWTGHHCITGGTFCTSAALMVLTIDRAPDALGTHISKR